MKFRTIVGTAGLCALLVAGSAIGHERSPRTAAISFYLPTDGSAFVDNEGLTKTAGVDDNGWFNTQLTAQHSYEIEVYAASRPLMAAGSFPVLTIAFFQGNGTTAYSASTINARSSSNPIANNCPSVFGQCYGGSRYTTVLPAGSNPQLMMRVTPNLVNEADIIFYGIRVTDTTLENPWFFIAGDYNAFTEIRNASDQTVAGTIYFWAPNGSLINSAAFSLSANGNTAINAANFVNRAINSSGSVSIVHDGVWGAIHAGSTTLSGTTGLSFDTSYNATHGPKLGSSFATSY